MPIPNNQSKIAKQKLFTKYLSSKQAQTTAFIIIGIIILATVSIAIMYSNWSMSTRTEKEFETRTDATSTLALEGAIQTAFEKTAAEALRDVGYQGLHHKIPNETRADDTALWVIKSINIMPSGLDFVELELEKYIDENLPLAPSFLEYTKQGFEIGPFEPKSRVTINNESISFEIRYNLEVKRDNFKTTFSRNFYEADVNFKNIYAEAVRLINYQTLNPNFDINDPLKDYEPADGTPLAYDIDTPIRINDTTLKYTITDLTGGLIEGRPMSLTFAVNIEHNDLPRQYDKNSTMLVSPDRFATLFFPEGSEVPISIMSYNQDSVVHKGVAAFKSGTQILDYKDVRYNTGSFPIYRFGPNGHKFKSQGVLNLWLNRSDSNRKIGNVALLYNGKSGWIPIKHNYDKALNVIKARVFGFSEYTAIECKEQSEDTFSAEMVAERSAWEAYGGMIMLIISLVFAIITLGLSLGLSLGSSGSFMGVGTTMSGIAQAGIIVNSIALVAEIGGLHSDILDGVLGVASFFIGLQALGTGLTLSAVGWFTAAGIYTGIIPDPLAYNGDYEIFDAENTIVVQAICTGDMEITKYVDGGECSCFVSEGGSGSTETEGSYGIMAGEIYTITPTVTNFDKGEKKATCTCIAEGLITSPIDESGPRKKAKEDPVVHESWLLPPAGNYTFKKEKEERWNMDIVSKIFDPILQKTQETMAHADEFTADQMDIGCCVSEIGYCLENYVGPYCVGEMSHKSCVDEPKCPEYINFQALIPKPQKPKELNDNCTLVQEMPDATLDIVIIGYNYTNASSYRIDVDNMITKLMDKPALGNYNIYKVKNLKSTDEEVRTIKDYTKEQCQRKARKSLNILVKPYKKFQCEQTPNGIVFTDADFLFRKSFNTVDQERIMTSFCYHTQPIEAYNAPRPTIHDIIDLNETHIQIHFTIEDEEPTVSYTLYLKSHEVGNIGGNMVPNVGGEVPSNIKQVIEIKHSGLPGRIDYYIQARDNQGLVSKSADETYTKSGVYFDFTGMSPLILNSDSIFISLDSVLQSYDIENLEATYKTNSPTCVKPNINVFGAGPGFELQRITKNCEADITILVTGAKHYSTSDSFTVQTE